MTLAFVTFLFLYAAIWLFERKHRRVDPFRVAVAAVVPIASMLLVATFGVVLLEPSVVLGLLSILVLAVTAFFMLWKVVDIPPLRCLAYVVAIFVFQVAFGAAFLYFELQMPEPTWYGDWEWPQ